MFEGFVFCYSVMFSLWFLLLLFCLFVGFFKNWVVGGFCLFGGVVFCLVFL